MVHYLWQLVSNLYINIKQKKRKIKRKALIRKIFQMILCFFMILISMSTLIDNLKRLQMAEQATTNGKPKNYTGKYDSEEYSSVLETVYFNSEINNEKETIWERFLLNEIGLSNYNVWSDESESIIELRKKYLGNITNDSILPPADLDKICEYIDYFYGTSFIPYTTRTLEEVSDEISADADASPELYAEELYLRSLTCAEGTFEIIYQLGRAADDAFKQSVKYNKKDDKQLIFFASITLAAYQLALCEYEDSIDTNTDITLIYYRMAEIYIYLDKHYIPSDECRFYKTHFKFSAEAYLARARIEYDPADEKLDMNEKYPYYDDYYAELLSYFIKQYDVHEDKITEEFYRHALTYIYSPYGKDGNVKNCNNLIEKMDTYLKNKYDEIFDKQSLINEIMQSK